MDRKIIAFILLVLAVLLIASCNAPVVDNNNGTGEYAGVGEEVNITLVNESNSMSALNDSENITAEKDEPKIEEIDESKASFKIEGVEGDTIKIPVKAVDPDGDFLEYTFEDPFNEKGLWQSKIGDEGKYLTKVTVSDGTLSTSEYVLIELARANRPPVIECPSKIEVNEGEKVVLDCNIYDVDGDVVLVGYDGWMKTSSYTTTFGDAGTHTVVVRAKDQTHDVFEEVFIEVSKTNRAPVIKIDDSNLKGMETEKITLNVEATDPDEGDEVTLAFSEPFNKNGEWTPDYGDAGKYEVKITASDGKTETSKGVEVYVEKKNRAPVLKALKDVSVSEGEKIKLPVSAFDPDGDDVVISYKGLMDSEEYETTYDDAFPNGCDKKGCTAKYTETVTVSDGVLSTSQDVTIEIEDKNRPPEFVFG